MQPAVNLRRKRVVTAVIKETRRPRVRPFVGRSRGGEINQMLRKSEGRFGDRPCVRTLFMSGNASGLENPEKPCLAEGFSHVQRERYSPQANDFWLRSAHTTGKRNRCGSSLRQQKQWRALIGSS